MWFKKLAERAQARINAVNKARENYVSWVEISRSPGWKVYQEKIDKEVKLIENQILHDVNLSGDDLKKLQLALRVWEKVNRIPKELLDNAKGGIK